MPIESEKNACPSATIERSAKILMPLLFVILIILSVHSLLMPGGEAGLKFLK